MVKTIGNPLSVSAKGLAGGGSRLREAFAAVRSDLDVHPRVHAIGLEEIRAALRLGGQDMMRFRSDVIALVFVYPLVGLMLVTMAFQSAMMPMIFPIAAGFVLLGPVAAIGMYELSRRHDRGETTSWAAVIGGLRAEQVGPVMVLGGYLLMLYLLWMAAAMGIYNATLGPDAPVSLSACARDILSTTEGWSMVWMGWGVGAVFAAVVLATTLVAFPMLMHRPVGLPIAVTTSMRVATKNPFAVAVWGMVVAGALFLAALPLFLGLVIVLPWLGHATWHLYRMAVSYD